MLDAIANHLAAHDVGVVTATFAKDATGITFEAIPPSPDNIVALTLYDGPESDERNAQEYPRLQVRTRGTTDPRTSRDTQAAALAALRAMRGVVLDDGTHVTDCYPLASAPTSMGQDTTGRWEHTRNYQLYVDQASSSTT